MSDTVIVKVQRSRAPIKTVSMIHDEANEHPTMVVLPYPAIKAMGRDMKAYFNAHWDGKAWHIGARVEDQSW